MSKIVQKSLGDNSPNVSVEGDLVLAIAGNKNLSRELKTITTLISVISTAAEQSDVDTTVDYEKQLSKKLERFASHADQIKHDYGELRPIYGRMYEECWEAANVDEITRKKVAIYLSTESIVVLTQNSDNPLLALAQLISQLENTMPEGVEYDDGAVKFFLLSQFVECKLFSLQEFAT